MCNVFSGKRKHVCWHKQKIFQTIHERFENYVFIYLRLASWTKKICCSQEKKSLANQALLTQTVWIALLP